MLAKINRLTKRKDFEALFKIGHSVYGQFLGLKYRQNQNASTKATVIVSKKVAKRAVERNRLKRQLRVLLRLNLVKFNGLDLAIIVLPGAELKNFAELEQEFNQLVKRLRLI